MNRRFDRLSGAKGVISLVLAAVLIAGIFGMTACKKEKKPEIEDPITIMISIEYPRASKLNIVENISFKVEKGSTVMETIQLFCNVHDIPLSIDTTYGTVEGINDVDNDVLKKGYSWQYMVNDKLQNKEPSEKVLKSGDSLAWIYAKKPA